jgi:hypothetical protein
MIKRYPKITTLAAAPAKKKIAKLCEPISKQTSGKWTHLDERHVRFAERDVETENGLLHRHWHSK